MVDTAGKGMAEDCAHAVTAGRRYVEVELNPAFPVRGHVSDLRITLLDRAGMGRADLKFIRFDNAIRRNAFGFGRHGFIKRDCRALVPEHDGTEPVRPFVELAEILERWREQAAVMLHLEPQGRREGDGVG